MTGTTKTFSTDPMTCIAAAQREDTPLEWLKQLAVHENFYVRKAVAQRDYYYLPNELALILSTDKNSAVLGSLLQNRQYLPVDALMNLAQSKAAEIREKVAKREDLTEEVCELLLKGDDSWVSRAAARNRRIPPATLNMLVNHKSVVVHQEALANPSCPVETLRKFGDNLNIPTACGLAANPNTPLDVLVKLVSINHYEVTDLLVYHLSCTPQLVKAMMQEGHIFDSSKLETVVNLLMEQDPEFAGYPFEWVEAVVSGNLSDGGRR